MHYINFFFSKKDPENTHPPPLSPLLLKLFHSPVFKDISTWSISGGMNGINKE